MSRTGGGVVGEGGGVVGEGGGVAGKGGSAAGSVTGGDVGCVGAGSGENDSFIKLRKSNPM
jgi:hypothetical protein